MNSTKERTRTFTNMKTDQKRERMGYTPEKSEGKSERYNQDLYKVRFRKKNLESFEPKHYVTAQLAIDDVIDLKEVFDTYDSTGMGVLLPNDLILLLTQNGFNPNKKTVYEIIAQYDEE